MSAHCLILALELYIRGHDQLIRVTLGWGKQILLLSLNDMLT